MNDKRNKKFIATARCHPKDKADNRGVLSRRSSKSEGEDGYFNGPTGLPVGIHIHFAFKNVQKWDDV